MSKELLEPSAWLGTCVDHAVIDQTTQSSIFSWTKLHAPNSFILLPWFTIYDLPLLSVHTHNTSHINFWDLNVLRKSQYQYVFNKKKYLYLKEEVKNNFWFLWRPETRWTQWRPVAMNICLLDIVFLQPIFFFSSYANK